MTWRSSSSRRICGCTNGWRRKRAISPTRGSTTSSATNCARPTARRHDLGDKVGAYQTFEQAAADVSCACHWTVNVAASVGHGKLYADAYSVAPAGVFVPAEFADQHAGAAGRRADLGRLPVGQPLCDDPGAGAVHAARPRSALSFADGLLFRRMEKLIDGEVPAASLFSGPYYFAEQLGFRKVIDTTFMMASMITGEPDPEDVRRYFAALRRAQRDIDLRPERYTHYYRNEFPERFHAMMDTRRWGPGERLVFEPYTKEVFEQAFDWIAEHEIFAPGRWARVATRMRCCRYRRPECAALRGVRCGRCQTLSQRRWRCVFPLWRVRLAVRASGLPGACRGGRRSRLCGGVLAQ